MKFFKILLIGAIFVSAVPPNILQKRIFSDLEFIKNCFEVKYAPLEWKKEHLNWDLQKEHTLIKNEILNSKQLNLKDFQVLLKKFFNTTKDYHVGVTYYSTESATLPLTIMNSGERYFIVYINQDEMPHCGVEIGDEVISFDGKKIHTAVREMAKNEFGLLPSKTDLTLATLLLTSRCGKRGMVVPQGEVSLVIKKKSGEMQTHVFEWDYTQENMRDFSKLGVNVSLPIYKKEPPVSQVHTFFKKMMTLPNFDCLNVAHNTFDNRYTLGAKRSFVPRLGKRVWETDEFSNFDAYIFMMPKGYGALSDKRVGYIRIPHYSGDSFEAEEFEDIIRRFRDKTEALVIDQINNPGGSLFYLYALATMLTDVPLHTPKHCLTLTQEEVSMALRLLDVLEEVTDDETASLYLGASVGGYPIDYAFAELLKEFCLFLVDEWNEGNIFTSPIHMFGCDELQPHPTTQYTKPILLLTNHLDFSGGDFFPAILQDNKRVTILGTPTAGAGGYIITLQFPNQTGIERFCLTGSFALREMQGQTQGKMQGPIENLGVTPDIFYDVSVQDLQSNYSEYTKKILKTLEEITKIPVIVEPSDEAAAIKA